MQNRLPEATPLTVNISFPMDMGKVEKDEGGFKTTAKHLADYFVSLEKDPEFFWTVDMEVNQMRMQYVPKKKDAARSFLSDLSCLMYNWGNWTNSRSFGYGDLRRGVAYVEGKAQYVGYIGSKEFVDVRRKKANLGAKLMDKPFSVDTPKGLKEGKAGDWLMQGEEGLYPLSAKTFERLYEIVEKPDA